MSRTGRFNAFVRGMLILLAPLAGAAIGAPPAAAMPTFKHVILVIQENRTPDNIFGSNPNFEPGVDIAGVFTPPAGGQIPLQPQPWVTCYDLDHSHRGFEMELTRGFNKWNLHPVAGCPTKPAVPALSYLDNSQGQVQPYFDIASNYGFANRMFQTNQGPSFPAHLFLFSGTSTPMAASPLFLSENMSEKNQPPGCIGGPGQLTGVINALGQETLGVSPCGDHRTLADVLTKQGLSWRYYTPTNDSIWTAPVAIAHLCEAAVNANGKRTCMGPAFTGGEVVAGNPAQILTDVADCNLAAMNWVIPTAHASDHANETDGSGPAWVASILNAVGQNPTCATGENYWQDTAIIVTWDDWGGWYDHVSPFAINIETNNTPQWGDGYTYGFRVPLLVASAYTPAGLVDNTIHDFGSILYFIEQNFGLPFIGTGATIYDNYADYQAAQRADDLGGFFPLTTPRAYTPIASAIPPSYFLAQPTPTDGPDRD